MKDLINIIGEYKHKVSSEELDEIMITYLYNYVNARPNNMSLGQEFRKDVQHVHELFLTIKEKREKTKILD